MKSLIIIEDDPRLGESLVRDFQEEGFTVTHVATLESIPSNPFDYALVDMRLANGELGLDALKLLRSRKTDMRIVVMSGYGSVTAAVEAMKRGADDVVLKPIGFLELKSRIVGEATELDLELKRPTLSEFENEYIEYVLVENKGNISRTAKDLGLMRQSLQRKLKKHPR